MAVEDQQIGWMFSHVSPEERVPAVIRCEGLSDNDAIVAVAVLVIFSFHSHEAERAVAPGTGRTR